METKILKHVNELTKYFKTKGRTRNKAKQLASRAAKKARDHGIYILQLGTVKCDLGSVKPFSSPGGRIVTFRPKYLPEGAESRFPVVSEAG